MKLLRRVAGAVLLVFALAVMLALAGQYAFEAWVAWQEPVVDPGRAPAPPLLSVPAAKPGTRIQEPQRPADATPEGLTGQLSTSTWPPAPISLQTADRVQQLNVLGGYNEYVGSLAFSPDGQLLAAGGRGVARVLQLPEGREVFVFKDEGYGPVRVVFSPTGHLAAFGTVHSIALYDAGSWTEKRVIENRDGWSFGLRFGSDGSYVAAVSADNAVTLWDVETGRELLRVQGHGLRDSSTSVSDLATSLRNSRIAVSDLAISPQGDLLATASYDRTVKLWSLPEGRFVRTLSNPVGEVVRVQFSPDGKVVASGSEVLGVKLWDAASGNEIRVMRGQTNRITSISFSPDGSLLATGWRDRAVRLYDVETGRELRTFEHGDEVWDVVFSPDGRFLASGSRERVVRLWGVK